MFRRAALIALVAGILAVACSVQDSEDLTPESVSSATGTGGDRGSTSTSTGEGGSGTGGVPPGAGGQMSDFETTPNKIACGDAVCDLSLGEICCPGSATACSTQPDCGTLGPMGDPPSFVGCDDAADCADGEICCITDSGDSIAHACSQQADCYGFESCIPNGSCSEGLDCVPNSATFTGAECVGADAQVTCGSTFCEDGASCCNDQSAVCVQPGSSCGYDYACDGPSDCGPSASCCSSLSGAGSVCMWGGCFTLTFCNSDADCPTGSCVVRAGLDVPDGYKVCK